MIDKIKKKVMLKKLFVFILQKNNNKKNKIQNNFVETSYGEV